MTLYLRNQKRQTLVDIEVYKSDGNIDISASVMIGPYSQLLLSAVDKQQVIEDFEFLSELRGWFWESYCEKNDIVVFSEVEKKVKDILREIGDAYGLYVVED